MEKHGLTFDRASETFVVADESVFIGWAKSVLGKAIFRDIGVDPDAPPDAVAVVDDDQERPF